MEELHLSKNVTREVSDDNRPTLEICKAPTSRRTLAFFFDLVCVIVLALFFQSCVVGFAYSAIFGTAKSQEALILREKESHLLVDDTSGESNGLWISETYDFTDSEASAAGAFAHFDTPITYFYTEFHEDDVIEIKEYHTLIYNSGYFVCSIDVNSTDYVSTDFTYSLKTTATLGNMKSLYLPDSDDGAFDTALNALYHDETVYNLGLKVFWDKVIQLVISSFLASLIIYYIIPACTKRRYTFGQRFLNVCPVSRATGMRITQGQLFLRFFMFFFVEILCGIITIGIIPLISFSMMCFNKESASLHDYASATIVVDTRHMKVFVNQQEVDEWKAQQMTISQSTFAYRRYESANNTDRATYFDNTTNEKDKEKK